MPANQRPKNRAPVLGGGVRGNGSVEPDIVLNANSINYPVQHPVDGDMVGAHKMAQSRPEDADVEAQEMDLREKLREAEMQNATSGLSL